MTEKEAERILTSRLGTRNIKGSSLGMREMIIDGKMDIYEKQ